MPMCHNRASAAKKQIPNIHCFWQTVTVRHRRQEMQRSSTRKTSML
uniref:Uncharacterized protein n=1 Tax=Arundo donax TaxID=35708 RepID=A0A0A8XWX1_ARUDO